MDNMEGNRRRRYQETHPWISFRVDLTEAPSTLWMLLGEARSKIEHIGGVPLKPEAAEALYRLFLAKGVQATTAIEGNTLTEEQVLKRVEGQLRLPESQEYLGQEVDNIVEAVNQIADELENSGPVPLTPETFMEYNRLVLKGLPLDPVVIPGEIRRHSVGVGSYRAVPAEDCSYLLARLAEWLNGEALRASDGHPDMAMVFAIIRAIVAHVYFAWIHPFGDGNGRTSRLIEFQILVSAGVPMPAAQLLSNHYNKTRAEYYRQLEQSSQNGGDLVSFLSYAVQGLVDGLREEIDYIRNQQMRVAWENYVYESFRSRRGPTADRQRAVVLALSERSNPVPKPEIRELTPRIAAEYAGKTAKTLSRDLNKLEAMNLVERVPDGYRARTETVLAFLPRRVTTNPS